MDWLSDAVLLNVFCNIQGVKNCDEDEKLAMSLPHDYEKLMPKMLESLSKGLKKVHYDRKVKQCKDNEKSLSLREQGNKAFLASQNDPVGLGKALELYTKSIAHAVPHSEEISFSYANRSAVLLRLKKWPECLGDIERAFASNYPENLKSKLYDRMAECHSKLAEESYIDAKFWLDKVPKNGPIVYKEKLQNYPSTKESDHVVNEESEIPELKSPNRKYPSASDAVDLRYSDAFGRHLVATRDINVGEILVIEKPYLQFLLPEKIYTHCAYCMGFLMAGIACDGCVNAVYCSRDCQDKAWAEYHQMECPLFDVLVQYYLISVEVHSSRTAQTMPFTPGVYLRLLIRMYREAGGLQQLKERVTAILGSNIETQFNIKDAYQPTNSLESVLNLTSYEKVTTQLVWASVTVSSLRILFLLVTSTDFFNNRYDESTTFDVEILTAMMNNPDVIFIGKLLLKLMHLLRNAYGAAEYTSTNPLQVVSPSCRGMMLLPFTSLINHSCAPNSFMQFKRNHIVLYSDMPIKKGEQVFDCPMHICEIFSHEQISVCYHQDYRDLPKMERQKFLRENYFFTCNCVACRNDWSAVDASNVTTTCAQYTLVKKNARVHSVIGPIIEILDKVVNKSCLQDKEQMMEQLCHGIKVICGESDVRSPEAHVARSILHSIYSMTGLIFPLPGLVTK